MKLTKTKLRQIIKEELETVSVGAGIEDFPEPEEVDDPDLGLGTPEETLLTLMRAREILDRFESFEELAEAFPEISHDEALARWVAAIKENPMYGSSLEEGWGQGDRAYQQATQLLGQFAQLHGLVNNVAQALRQGKISPQQVQQAVRGASSSYHVAQRLGLE